MTRDKILVRLPMKRSLFEKLQVQARAMGFDSVQGYIRFWAAAETDASVNRGGLSIYQDVSTPEGQALRYFELWLAFHYGEFGTMGQAVDYCMRQVRRVNMQKMLDSMLRDQAEERKLRRTTPIDKANPHDL